MGSTCFSILIVCIFVIKVESLCQTTPGLEDPPEGYSYIAYRPLEFKLLNPGRGYAEEFSVETSTFKQLSMFDLDALRLASGITVVKRHYVLERFKNTFISQKFLNDLNKDLDVIRNAGFMAIIRFSYIKGRDKEHTQMHNDVPKHVIRAHIAQLRDILHRNRGIILTVQAGFIGVWGEWYFTDHFGTRNLSQQNFLDRRDVLNDLLYAVPESIQVQLRNPLFKRTLYGQTATTAMDLTSESRQRRDKARIGLHNDCFLADSQDRGTYQSYHIEYPYLKKDSLYTIMGGETCAVDTVTNRTSCPIAEKELQELHFTFLSQSYIKPVLDLLDNQTCYDRIGDKLGYVLSLKRAILPNEIARGDAMSYHIVLVNEGYAAPAKEFNVLLVLMTTSDIYAVPIDTNTRTWFPGGDITLTGAAAVPRNIKTSVYQVWLAIGDKDMTEESDYYILLHNDMVPSTEMGLNNLTHAVSVVDGSSFMLSDCPKFEPWKYPKFSTHPRVLHKNTVYCQKSMPLNYGFETNATSWIGLWDGFYYRKDANQAFKGQGYMEIPSTPLGGAAYQTWKFTPKRNFRLTRIKVEAWARLSEAVPGMNSGPNYSLYCDVTFRGTAGNYRNYVPFREGPEGTVWNKVTVLIEKKGGKPSSIRSLTCYLVFKGYPTGSAYFDNMRVMLISGGADFNTCNFLDQ